MKWYMDKKYMSNHIKSYVEFQLGQGYELDDVKHALEKYGYEPGLVNEICSQIDPDVHKPLKHRPSIKELNEDLYVYLQNLLIDYIKKEQSQGYELEVIRKALINYGHHPKMVRHALEAANEGYVVDQQPTIRLPAWLSLALGLAAIFAFVAVLTIQTSADLGLVFLSFAPSIVTILLVYAAFVNIDNKRTIQLLPVAAVFLSAAIFLAVYQAKIVYISEPQTILALNAVLTFIPSSMICLMSRQSPKKISAEEIAQE